MRYVFDQNNAAKRHQQVKRMTEMQRKVHMFLILLGENAADRAVERATVQDISVHNVQASRQHGIWWSFRGNVCYDENTLVAWRIDF